MENQSKKTENSLRSVGSIDRIVSMQMADEARESYDHPRWKLQRRGGGPRCRAWYNIGRSSLKGRKSERRSGSAKTQRRTRCVVCRDSDMGWRSQFRNGPFFSHFNLDCELIVRKQRQSIPHRTPIYPMRSL